MCACRAERIADDALGIDDEDAAELKHILIRLACPPMPCDVARKMHRAHNAGFAPDAHLQQPIGTVRDTAWV